MTALWVIIACGLLAIVYGIWATMSVMKADAGSAKMQEIAAAVREGAQAVEAEGSEHRSDVRLPRADVSTREGLRCLGHESSVRLSFDVCRVGLGVEELALLGVEG